MPFRYEGVKRSDKREQSLLAGLMAMGTQDAKVVVTADFDRTIDLLTGGEGFSSERGSGSVAAKTIPDIANGDAAIIVNHNAIAHLEGKELERLAAHEAGHVLIARRGESVTGRHYLAGSQTDYTFAALSGLALEEFRIERHLLELGYSAPSWVQPADMHGALLSVNVDTCMAVTDPENHTDIPRFAQCIFDVVDRLSKILAYVTAAAVVDQMKWPIPELDAHTIANWSDYVLPTWDARVDFYESVPSVGTALDSDYLDRQFLAGAVLETKMLESFGFSYTDLGDGELRFWRLEGTDEMFDDRFARARSQLALLNQDGVDLSKS